MKILLINAINKKRDIEDSFPHLGFAYIASYLEKFLACPQQIMIINDDIEQSLQTFRPDIVGVSSVSQNFTIAKKICALAKGIGASTIIGGVHISMLPESLDKNMDCGVIGEGEQTMLDIARAFQEHGSIIPDFLTNIPGVVFRDTTGTLQITPDRQLIKPLDILPLPKRELLSIPSNGTTSIFSSRGCPYRCVFCASARYWDITRQFSAEYVIEEIKNIFDRFSSKFISFKDDIFISNKNRLRKIVEYIEREGINKRVSFFVSCRANLVDRETARLLKKMNVVHASMGLESGCKRTLDYLKGDTISLQKGLDAIQYLSDEKIHVNASFIIGSPTETKDEILETLAFIKQSGLSSFQTYIMTPFPGTPIWDHALERGLVSNDMDWEKLTIDFADDPAEKIIVSETLSRKELHDLYMLFLKEQKKKYNISRIKRVMTNPMLIGRYLWRKGSNRIEV